MAMGSDFVVLCDSQGKLVSWGGDDEGQTCVGKLALRVEHNEQSRRRKKRPKAEA